MWILKEKKELGGSVNLKQNNYIKMNYTGDHLKIDVDCKKAYQILMKEDSKSYGYTKMELPAFTQEIVYALFDILSNDDHRLSHYLQDFDDMDN